MLPLPFPLVLPIQDWPNSFFRHTNAQILLGFSIRPSCLPASSQTAQAYLLLAVEGRRRRSSRARPTLFKPLSLTPTRPPICLPRAHPCALIPPKLKGGAGPPGSSSSGPTLLPPLTSGPFSSVSLDPSLTEPPQNRAVYFRFSSLETSFAFPVRMESGFVRLISLLLTVDLFPSTSILPLSFDSAASFPFFHFYSLHGGARFLRDFAIPESSLLPVRPPFLFFLPLLRS